MGEAHLISKLFKMLLHFKKNANILGEAQYMMGKAHHYSGAATIIAFSGAPLILGLCPNISGYFNSELRSLLIPN